MITKEHKIALLEKKLMNLELQSYEAGLDLLMFLNTSGHASKVPAQKEKVLQYKEAVAILTKEMMTLKGLED